jgi:hypothetical protein
MHRAPPSHRAQPSVLSGGAIGGDLLSAIRAGKKLQSRAAAAPPKPVGGDLLSQIREGRKLKSGAERKQLEPIKSTQGSLLDEIRNAKKGNLLRKAAAPSSAPAAAPKEEPKKGGIFDILARRAVLSKSSSSEWEDSESD